MPLYEYECVVCAHRFERIQKFSDPPIDVCPTCGGAVRKLISSPAIQFKGSGWYITDYAKKSGTVESASGKSDGGEKKSEKTDASESAAKAGTSESKPAAAPAPAKND